MRLTERGVFCSPRREGEGRGERGGLRGIGGKRGFLTPLVEEKIPSDLVKKKEEGERKELFSQSRAKKDVIPL